MMMSPIKEMKVKYQLWKTHNQRIKKKIEEELNY